MGQVKQAIIEVEDLVCGCLKQGRTLNQTVRDLKAIYEDTNNNNPDAAGRDLVEDKYYQFKGQQ